MIFIYKQLRLNKNYFIIFLICVTSFSLLSLFFVNTTTPGDSLTPLTIQDTQRLIFKDSESQLRISSGSEFNYQDQVNRIFVDQAGTNNNYFSSTINRDIVEKMSSLGFSNLEKIAKSDSEANLFLENNVSQYSQIRTRGNDIAEWTIRSLAQDLIHYSKGNVPEKGGDSISAISLRDQAEFWGLDLERADWVERADGRLPQDIWDEGGFFPRKDLVPGTLNNHIASAGNGSFVSTSVDKVNFSGESSRFVKWSIMYSGAGNQITNTSDTPPPAVKVVSNIYGIKNSIGVDIRKIPLMDGESEFSITGASSKDIFVRQAFGVQKYRLWYSDFDDDGNLLANHWTLGARVSDVVEDVNFRPLSELVNTQNPSPVRNNFSMDSSGNISAESSSSPSDGLRYNDPIRSAVRSQIINPNSGGGNHTEAIISVIEVVTGPSAAAQANGTSSSNSLPSNSGLNYAKGAGGLDIVVQVGEAVGGLGDLSHALEGKSPEEQNVLINDYLASAGGGILGGAIFGLGATGTTILVVLVSAPAAEALGVGFLGYSILVNLDSITDPNFWKGIGNTLKDPKAWGTGINIAGFALKKGWEGMDMLFQEDAMRQLVSDLFKAIKNPNNSDWFSISYEVAKRDVDRGAGKLNDEVNIPQSKTEAQKISDFTYNPQNSNSSVTGNSSSTDSQSSTGVPFSSSPWKVPSSPTPTEAKNQGEVPYVPLNPADVSLNNIIIIPKSDPAVPESFSNNSYNPSVTSQDGPVLFYASGWIYDQSKTGVSEKDSPSLTGGNYSFFMPYKVISTNPTTKEVQTIQWKSDGKIESVNSIDSSVDLGVGGVVRIKSDGTKVIEHMDVRQAVESGSQYSVAKIENGKLYTSNGHPLTINGRVLNTGGVENKTSKAAVNVQLRDSGKLSIDDINTSVAIKNYYSNYLKNNSNVDSTGNNTNTNSASSGSSTENPTNNVGSNLNSAINQATQEIDSLSNPPKRLGTIEVNFLGYGEVPH